MSDHNLDHEHRINVAHEKLIRDVLLSLGNRSAANAMVFMMHHGLDETTAKRLIAFPELRRSTKLTN